MQKTEPGTSVRAEDISCILAHASPRPDKRARTGAAADDPRAPAPSSVPDVSTAGAAYKPYDIDASEAEHAAEVIDNADRHHRLEVRATPPSPTISAISCCSSVVLLCTV